jgi:sulfide:quinone oxidoreductase
MSNQREVLIIGGGTGGLTVAARLLARPDAPRVTVLEPNDTHYYQPLWSLVGAGVFPRERSARPEADYMPRGAEWVRDAALEIDPEAHRVRTRSGDVLEYGQLVVAPGMQLDWHAIEGLDGNLGADGICSNYTYETVDSTWRTLQGFEGGNAVFTFPSTPVKCAGAAQKIMYLADDYLRRQGRRGRARVIFVSAAPSIFGVREYAETLEKVVARKGIETHFRRELVAVRPASREAVFRHLDDGDELILPYELLHIVPPQGAPDFIRQSPLATEAGWVDVDKYTLQHVRHPDVFALGDASSLPASRTGAAVAKQAPVLVENLMAHRAGRSLRARYDGYGSCPLITGFGSMVLAEFDYQGRPAETFPFDQSQERFSMWLLKAYGLPELYWNGLLRGRL